MNSQARHPLRRRRPLFTIGLLGATLAAVPAAGAAAAPTKPAVTTSAASGVTYQGANLRGAVNPGGQATTYFFQYGLTAKYGSTSLPANLAAGTRAVSVSSPVAGLVPVTKYHFRLVAVNAMGTATGADVAFTTAPVPLSLSIAGLPNPVTFGDPLSVVGALTGTGAANKPVVLQQNPYPYTAGFQSVGNSLNTTPAGIFQFNLLSLAQNTQFRVVGGGAGQVAVSPVLTEQVGLGVSMHVRTRRIRGGSFSLRFSGVVRPAEVGARVSVQRLVRGVWRRIAATNARASTADSSSYALTTHRRHGGFFRVFVLPVEGGHTANSSQPLLVHAGTGSF